MKLSIKMTLVFFAAGITMSGIMAIGCAPDLSLAIKLVLLPLIALFAGLLIAKIFVYRISILAEDVEAARSGSIRYRPSLKSNDEIGHLAAVIDGSVKELREKSSRLMEVENELGLRNIDLKRVRAAEEHFRRLFEQANDAVIVHDVGGRITDVNKKACEMMGYAREQLLNMTFLDLHTDEELARVREARLVNDKTPSLHFETEFKRSSGEVINVRVSASIVDLKKGVMQAVITNITEQKNLEKALRESEEKFRTFMETASDLMYVADRDGRISYVNSAMFNALGYAENEMAGRNISEIMDKETREEYKHNRFELSKKGEVTYEPVWETRNRIKLQGEMKEVAIYDANGIFSGSRGIFRDISERKKIERAQRLAQLGELAADVAHEVNNPVMIIAARTELLLMDEKDHKKAENLKIILDQCEKAKDIVLRLLKFSKPSKGELKDTDANAALETTLKLIERQFLSSGVKIARKFGEALPTVKMDEKLMQEVFLNILKNAQEAMPEGGAITISTFREDDNIRMDFKDTGTGITEDDMKRLFDPFFTTKEQGTGLGLSVCYGIMKAHGGELRYSSDPGKGTTATVILPLSQQESAG